MSYIFYLFKYLLLLLDNLISGRKYYRKPRGVGVWGRCLKRLGGGMRRKRHHSRSKIIEKFDPWDQITKDHVQSRIFHP